MDYRAPTWLPGGQLQTIWPALYSSRHEAVAPSFKRERWASPDDDFVDVDFTKHEVKPDAPQLVLFHGLEGSSQSHYAQAFADWARQQAMPYAVPHFRGCSGEINRAPRAYHSGDYQEIDWLLRRIKAREPQRKLIAVGISLGGNALMRWAQEMGAEASKIASAVASVCSPLDLAAAGHCIGSGLNRRIYTPMFLRTMKPKAMERLALHPKLFDAKALQESRDLYEFDNIFTAPLHGFKNTEDYWARASAKPRMAEIQIPALALNALNDPFMPASSLPQPGKVGKHVTLWQPKHGGHVGFPGGKFPGHVHAMPRAVGQWLLHHG
ncbi:alpha/beta fold hydrolase [Variovorax sp. PCZ-1]|uniref:YheT family hydrolase n=1 Tax=Variovorax sp. PCZ-1 TaxID=2835533 RepID=UPI001BD0143E|nr:alpha/beta fold hydrolase [Variovorax sp. PCZ-1]MBS7806004.1 alpha/beta fold hydrolase [Variovorax sp. PCZ-1]